MGQKIDLKDAKCTKLTFDSAVNFLRQDGKDETDVTGFDIEAYTGAVVKRWWGNLIVAIDGITAKQQMPIFKNHDPDEIVGYSTSATKGDIFRVSGVFSKATEAAKEVQALAEEGFPWQASIGVKPKMILEIMKGSSMLVNGQDVEGPAEVWLESEVFETSFVPLGADGNTRVSVFSEIEQDANSAAATTMKRSKMDLEKLKKDHPDLVKAITEEALAGREAELAQAKQEGAEAERGRIQSVRMQLVPGHEALIESMAFDGKSTGADAALAIVAAEQQIRANAAESFKKEAPAVVPPVNSDVPETLEDKNAPVETRAKLAWDKSPDVREEFRTFSAYLAYRKAEAAGQVKIFGQK